MLPQRTRATLANTIEKLKSTRDRLDMLTDIYRYAVEGVQGR